MPPEQMQYGRTFFALVNSTSTASNALYLNLTWSLTNHLNPVKVSLSLNYRVIYTFSHV